MPAYILLECCVYVIEPSAGRPCAGTPVYSMLLCCAPVSQCTVCRSDGMLQGGILVPFVLYQYAVMLPNGYALVWYQGILVCSTLYNGVLVCCMRYMSYLEDAFVVAGTGAFLGRIIAAGNREGRLDLLKAHLLALVPK